MKLTTGIVALLITAGSAWAQNPAIIQNTKTALQGVPQQKTAASDAALQGTSTAKPSGAVPAKPNPAPAQTTTAKPATPAPANSAVKAVPVKTGQAPAKAQPATKTQPATQTPFSPKPVVSKAKPSPKVAAAETPATAKAAADNKAVAKDDKPEDKKYSMTGKRDPFVSPVVNRQGGSGCSTGKKCLDIEQIALHGVVKSDNGMIAVVTNGLNKAYFLRENDPVFNGYVVKITVDSIVFKETLQDRLGKPFTKDVVKRILTPAV